MTIGNTVRTSAVVCFFAAMMVVMMLPYGCNIDRILDIPDDKGKNPKENWVGEDPNDTSAYTTPGIVSIEVELFSLVNGYRQKKGLAPLEWRNVIREACRKHSLALAEEGLGINERNAHTDFEARVAFIDSFIPVKNANEIVAFNEDFEDAAIVAYLHWLSNEEQTAAILNTSYTMSGIGVRRNWKDQYYFTQIFIAGR